MSPSELDLSPFEQLVIRRVLAVADRGLFDDLEIFTVDRVLLRLDSTDHPVVSPA